MSDKVLKFDYAVIGFGLTGQSVIRFLISKGADLIAMDTRKNPPEMDHIFSGSIHFVRGRIDHAFLEASDKIVLSPGLSKMDLGFDIFAKYGAKVIGDIELFAQFAKAPVIAITGTNGKTTVTTLVGKMLDSAGLIALVGGNIGPPVLDLLAEPIPDFYVLELSSFQLETTNSLKPSLAAIVNFSEDHMDRYESLENYLEAKLRILKNAPVAVLNKDDRALKKIDYKGNLIGFGMTEPKVNDYGLILNNGSHYLSKGSRRILESKSLRLIGEHNISNVLAALAICGFFIEIRGQVIQTVLSFKGLPHRSEFVCTSKGITFVNDSKATNVGAAQAGIKSLMSNRGGVAIVGGLFKGGSIQDLASTIKSTVHTVVLIGRSADQFHSVLADKTHCIRAKNMESAVSVAAGSARKGEIVLLSPACSSLDMYRDYEARGVAFKEAVKKWEAA